MATASVNKKPEPGGKGEAESLSSEVKLLRDELEAVAALARQVGIDGVALARVRAKARLGEGLEKGQDAAARVADEVTAEWQAAQRRLVKEASEHPWRTFGVAALGGLALGLLIRR